MIHFIAFYIFSPSKLKLLLQHHETLHCLPTFLNQARAWFLKITSVRMYVCVSVCVCVCVCVRPRGHE